MVIRHNLPAMNAGRMLQINTGKYAASAEKLSSGYRINRAADNAAGLAISEKMRRQIRGLTQASVNCQDGISMVQIAEGALNEVHDMLHRLNELCVQAANGTATYEDRTSIQQEIDQINGEIDRVGASTTFNTLKLLNGLPQEKATAVVSGITVNGSTGTVTQATEDKEAFYKIASIQNGDIVHVPSPNEKYYKAATRSDIATYNKEWSDYYAAKNKYDIDKAKYDADKAAWDTDNTLFGGVEPTEPEEPTAPVLRDGTSSEKAMLVEVDKIYRDIADDLLNRNLANNMDVADQVSATWFRGANDGIFELHFYGPLPVNLQVGSEAGNTFSFEINAVNSGTLGVGTVYVKDDDGSGAKDGIEKIKAAIEKNSTERSNLGAIQNRLEHTIRNLDNVVENTTAAESRIRDTDMAREMVRFSSLNILMQAGHSMLAQANQSSQGVLSLLRV